MEVDKWLHCQVPVIIGPGLQGEQGVDVDWTHTESLLSCIVRITQGPAPINLHRVGRISSVARLSLGQTEGNSDVWLQLSCGGGGTDQVGQVSEYPLKRKTSVSFMLELKTRNLH